MGNENPFSFKSTGIRLSSALLPAAGTIISLVLGLRYTFDSFKRMLYAEYRLDNGTLFNGTERKNEITIGFR